MWNPTTALLLAALMVLANAFFVASEFAIVKIRPTRVRELVANGGHRAWLLSGITRRLDKYLSATQLGITLASLALGWIGEPAFAHLIEPALKEYGTFAPALAHSISVSVAFVIISILHIVFGELVPKSLAIQKPIATT